MKVTQPKPVTGLVSLWRNGNFLALWLAQVFSQIGDKVYLVLMIALLDQQFAAQESITPLVSGIMVAFTIPAVLFGSLAGVFVDRWRKQRVLLTTNLLRGILVLLIIPGFWFQWQPLVNWVFLLGITFFVSTLTQFFAPAEQAVMPLIVPQEQLLSANSLYTTTMMGSLILGFALGDPLLSMAAQVLPQGRELVVAGAYLLAALLLVRLHPQEQGTATGVHTLAQVGRDLREGWSALRAKPQLGGAVAHLIVLYTVFAALTVLTIQLAEQLLRPSQFGFLLAAAGAGVAVGALLLNVLRAWSYRRLSAVGSLVMGGALAGLAAATHSLPWALIGNLALGMGAALVAIPLQTLLQTETPEEVRGKVFGLQNNAVNIALSLPLAVTGLIATRVGLAETFLGLAGLVILMAIWRGR
ncbi:transporter, major facilitator family [Gloeomargarita lithophora Alchichica-D10]|uniref:Transporter, major facilitator family n=1 Tax=Gloeomargarita lithophora Alchichica-D10 TaxID=1188229 RepID=A0A1J0AGY6_9CYAN|nr:MFS transporter [Gloeomargarita lithophora]APB35209.1 transporter, major facilitator family [Gloeomargarita lithophora Alchichica-D10]